MGDLIGRLEFIRDYECSTNAEKETINETIKALEQEPVIDKIRAEIEQAAEKQLLIHTVERLTKDVKASAEYHRTVLGKIKGYVDHIRNTGMGKKKSFEYIEKFIEGLKAESEE